jgi:hypothetical protein
MCSYNRQQLKQYDLLYSNNKQQLKKCDYMSSFSRKQRKNFTYNIYSRKCCRALY